MCGICCEINFKEPVSTTGVLDMMKLMKHRGPDDEGIFLNKENSLALGFVRLSIIDLSSHAHQPMLSSDGRFVLIFNGEIYNYIELRTELIKQGYSFRSNSDSEVVLNAYIAWDEKCLDLFNGMFAFIIYDTKTSLFFSARDRFGVKPLYFSLQAHGLIFASEIPALLSALPQKPIVNEQAIYDFLVFNRTDQTENTFFENVKKLQHGHYMKIDLINNTVKMHRWYNLSSRLTNPFCSPNEFLELFSNSCGLRLRSDVPLGVCLSGGLDSSAIVSVLLKDHQLVAVNTFSAVYGQNEIGDESHFINLFRDQLENMHFITPNAESLAKDIDALTTTQGEPFPSTSIYAQYKLCELAKKNVTVLLDGQGADEYLAGYHYFYGHYYKELLKKARYSRLASELYYYLYTHKSFFALKSLLFFLLPSSTRTKLKVERYGYLLPEFEKRYRAWNIISDTLYGSSSLQEALLNHFEFKMEHNLLWNDKNSMRFSLELREPMLDYRLVERTLATNMDMIINKGYTKAILREAMNGYLSEEIRMRKDKTGFETPEDQWFRTPYLSELTRDIINNKSFKSRGIIDYKAANALFNQHLNNKINASKEIWKFVSLELWYRKFID